MQINCLGRKMPRSRLATFWPRMDCETILFFPPSAIEKVQKGSRWSPVDSLTIPDDMDGEIRSPWIFFIFLQTYWSLWLLLFWEDGLSRLVQSLAALGSSGESLWAKPRLTRWWTVAWSTRPHRGFSKKGIPVDWSWAISHLPPVDPEEIREKEWPFIETLGKSLKITWRCV